MSGVQVPSPPPIGVNIIIFSKIFNEILESFPYRTLGKKRVRALLWSNDDALLDKITQNVIIKKNRSNYIIIKGNNIIKINKIHTIYIQDILGMFEVYFNSIKPTRYKFFYKMVDVSKPKLHKLRGFKYKLILPYFDESIEGIEDYLRFYKINKDSVVLDLGSFSGATAIFFDTKIQEHGNGSGRVIAIEADKINYEISSKNLDMYRKKTGRKIDLLYCAVWSHSNGIEFSADSSMASSATEFIGKRGDVIQVPSITLMDLAEKYNLNKIDFIKCDIEGAEIYVFNDEFINKYNPSALTIEVHKEQELEKIVNFFKSHNYKVVSEPYPHFLNLFMVFAYK